MKLEILKQQPDEMQVGNQSKQDNTKFRVVLVDCADEEQREENEQNKDDG
jgi:hypothetical protein